MFSYKIIRNSIVSAVNTLTKSCLLHMQIISTDIENRSFEIGAIFLSFLNYIFNLSIIFFFSVTLPSTKPTIPAPTPA